MVVGIGASAGGLDAFKRFFGAMPSPTGLAFVLVQHLDPTHESLMADLLGRYTDMPVVQVEDEMPVEADHVYIIPPDRYLMISEGILRLTRPTERRGMRMPIDFFLISLAEDLRERAIGIILSGTASDGTLGIKAVKAQGGVTMVQDPKTAQYDGMPRSAMATGMVDYVLPVDQMPDTLVRYVQHFYVNGGAKVGSEIEKAPDHLETIARMIRDQTRLDLQNYKKSTVIRRIERRMGIHQVQEISQYVQLLMQNPSEVIALFKDLLINITNFFREPDAFACVEELVIPDLVRGGSSQRPIRVWIPGCSTGEEPYSVAMLLMEQLEKDRRSRSVQIFATDIDEEALETARAGTYPVSIAADITPDRLQKFFAKHETGYQISKRLREAVVFAPQNLIADPPFSKMDLILCRNLLIYLEPQVQNKVIALLHFALNPGGYLFLGNSETLGVQQDLFAPVSKKWRIYQRVAPLHRTSVEFPLFSPEARAARPSAPSSPQPPSAGDLLHHFLIEQYAPASVLVNRNCDVVYLHGGASEYLQFPDGEPTRDLLAMAPESWRIKLRAALHRASRAGKRSSVSGLRRDGDRGSSIRVSVTPLRRESSDGLMVVAFEPVREQQPRDPVEATPEESVARQLETELRMTREDLQNTIEQLETSNEELKASNEEVMSMNEELQSTNEELETSKEELQSLNEELGTVNNQLQEKVQELEAANTDLANVLASTDVATLFLDRAFKIKRYTPAITGLLRLIPSDVGRPLMDITRNFSDPNLLDDASRVLREGVVIESEVQAGHKWYLRRALPYRSLENEIGGVVITFADVTALKAAAQEIETRSRQRQAVAELGRLALGNLDLQSLMQHAAEQVSVVLGVDYAEVLELLPDGAFLMRAGKGWREGLVGSATIGGGPESLAGRALESNQPVIVDDLAHEGRSGLDPLLAEHPVTSSAWAPVRIVERPFGVLGVDTVRRRSFSSADLACLQAVADVLSQAVERKLFEDRLESLNRSLEQRVAERTSFVRILLDAAVIANQATSIDSAFKSAVARVCAGLGCAIGHIYRRAEGSPELEDAEVWVRPDDPRYDEFVASRRFRRYKFGEGMVGRAAAQGAPVHIYDASEDADLKAASDAGLVNAACAVPVTAAGDVVAVLEFFGTERVAADEELLGVLAQLGAQLGRVVERKRIEQRIERLNHDLQQRVSEFETLMNVMPVAIAIAFDPECKDIRVNQTFAHMLGVSTGLNTSATGPNSAVLPFRFLRGGQEVPAADLPQQRCGREAAAVTGVELDLDAGGTIYHLLGNVSPLFNEAGGVRGSVAAYLDVTANKVEERRRRDFEERMQQTQKLESLGVLAGGIAHDFNNLLTAIMGNAELARNALPPHSPVRPSLVTIVDTSAKLAGLTQQLLAYAGRGQFMLQRIRLSEIVDDMKHLFALSVSKNCTVRYELDATPAIEADVVQLRQVAMNLVMNASEAIGTSAGVVLIRTGEMMCHRDTLAGAFLGGELPEGVYSLLEVRDTGAGMTPDVVSRIFDPFFTTKFAGRGLGLAAVMGIMRGHKGAIQVVSTPGQGAMFRVLFPVAGPALEIVSGPAQPEQDWSANGSVLIADDEEKVREVARRMVERVGVDTIAARDGAEAVALFREHRAEIRAIILDLTMPNMSAEDAFDKLRQIDASVPIIICSGYSEQEVSGRFKDRQVAGYIQKPFLIADMVAALKGVLDRAE
ncbi:MAG: GAF domain-containing protein [Acidobacteria bacterium]|nr:GAF domain-containing protein [Acidobacteriota bacterium]